MPPGDPDDNTVGETLLDILVDRMHGHGAPARQLWLPPLRESVPLSALLPSLAADPDRGFTVTEESGLHGALRAVVGVLDLPRKQRRDPLGAGSIWRYKARGGDRCAAKR